MTSIRAFTHMLMAHMIQKLVPLKSRHRRSQYTILHRLVWYSMADARPRKMAHRQSPYKIQKHPHHQRKRTHRLCHRLELQSEKVEQLPSRTFQIFISFNKGINLTHHATSPPITSILHAHTLCVITLNTVIRQLHNRSLT